VSLRTLVLAGGLAVCLLIAAALIISERLKVQVWVVNGLDVPLLVKLGEKSLPVGAKSKASIKVPRRSFEVVATRSNGTVVDRETITPEISGSKIVFNVLGASPLHVYGVLYSFHGLTMDTPQATTMFFRRVLEREDIDYFFEDAPMKIEVDSNDKPGPKEKLVLSADADWRMSLSADRAAEALKLAEAVAAAEPEVQEALDAVERLKPQPVVAPRVKTREDWQTTSLDSHARLMQRPAAEGKCDVRCDTPNGNAWTMSAVECIAREPDDRFVTSDCNRVVVVRRVGERPQNWRESGVVFVYSRGFLDETIPTGRFLTDESKLQPAGTGFVWLFGGAHASSDGLWVEFESADRKKHRVPLTPKP
jgi:hypothetical protein